MHKQGRYQTIPEDAMKAAYSLVPLIFSTCLGAQASTHTFAELPADIQGCMQAGTCVVSPNSNADFGNASFFDYATFSPAEGVVNRQLVRYGLTPPSAKAHSLTSTYDSDLDDFSYSALGGSVWLAADNVYNLADSRHTFTLYLDRVSPAPDNLWGWYDHPLTKIISISTAELLAGHGHYSMDFLDNYAEQGSLRLHALPGDAGYPYLSCIECSVNIDFNLVGLQYLDFGPVAMLTTNPQDTRALLYLESSYQHEGSYTGSRSQTFYVAAVPEPSSWRMLLAGVGLVGWAARRRMA
jgi:hypothetical protein